MPWFAGWEPALTLGQGRVHVNHRPRSVICRHPIILRLASQSIPKTLATAMCGKERRVRLASREEICASKVIANIPDVCQNFHLRFVIGIGKISLRWQLTPVRTRTQDRYLFADLGHPTQCLLRHHQTRHDQPRSCRNLPPAELHRQT
jgi:hypothetical protein